MVLWGLPISMVIAFLLFRIADFRRNNKLVPVPQTEKKKVQIFHFMEYLNVTDLFILTIGLCAIGLILLPEIIYVEDIYTGDYKRANTMFKLTYQAYIMFGICFGYLFIRLLRFGETIWQRIYTTIGLIFFLCTMFYVGNAVHAWFGNIFDHSGYKGMDASAFMEKQMPDDYLAIEWLNGHVTGLPVTLEAPGDSYTDYERVSVMTGLPTLLGWHTHEWLWKSDTSLLDERTADIQTIYTSTDEDLVKSLIKQYNIQYIYVGKLEQDKYAAVNNDLLKSLGEVVFDSPITNEKAYETYIVQITN
jgi:YYY domain-containing protein